MNDRVGEPLPTLRGTRCTLRALRPADAPALQRHADDPAVAFNLFDGFARNAGSQAVSRKAGCVLEGRLPHAVLKNGEAIDAVLYGAYRPGPDIGAAA